MSDDAARLLALLRAAGGPVGFAALAAAVCPDASPERGLRVCRHLVAKLRAAGVPVRSRRGVGYWIGEAGAVPQPALPVHRAARVRPDEADLLRGLWAEVLTVAIEDAAGRPRCASNLSKVEKRVAVADARRWLGTPQFQAVCTLAGVDAGAVLARLRGEGLCAVALRLAPPQPQPPRVRPVGQGVAA